MICLISDIFYRVRKQLAKSSLMNRTVKIVYMNIKNKIVRINAVKEIRRLKALIKSEKIIWYLDTPTHPNMGDLAQYCCIKKWLTNNYSEYTIVEISADTIVNAESEFLMLLKSKKFPDNIIVFQSGYCTQDLGGTHDYVHKLVVKQFKDTPIIMLPQTILYKDKNNERVVSEVYETHDKLMVLCRDFLSLDTAQRIFEHNKCLAFPDIVTSLIGKREVLSKNSRKGILVCCRNDSERYYNDVEIDLLVKKLEVIDKVTVSDTSVQRDFYQLKSNIEKHVNDMIAEFGTYRAVVTDRYHGTIFSLIAGTPVIVIKSNDHKVVTGVDWFKGIYDGSVFHIETLNQVPGKVEELYHNYIYKELTPYFEEKYYSKLKNIIEEWRREKVN